MWRAFPLASMIAGIFWIVAAVIGASPAHAQSAVVGVPLPVCVSPARPGDEAAAMFASPERFDCTTGQLGFGPGDFWVVTPPLTRIPDLARRDRVRIASLWQGAVTLYARYPDGYVAAWRYDGHGVTRHLQLGAMIEWRLPDRAAPPVRLMWRIDRSANLRGILLSPRLATAAESDDANMAMAALYAAFGGLSFALLIYNLAMWTALRHRFQLAYCGMVATLSVYAFTSSGALAWTCPWIGNNERLRINYILLACAAIAALSFVRTFFPRSVTSGWVDRLTGLLTIVSSAVALVFALLAPWHIRLLDSLYSLAFACVVASVVPIIVRAWRQRIGLLWLFACAWVVPILFAAMRLLGDFTLVPWSFWLDNSTILSMAFEAVVSTLAIAHRIRRLSIERDEALEREVIAARLADTDPLTGLLNRRAFLRQAIGREGPHVLVLGDLDHFKRVNETLGHDGGDEVLRVFARTLRKTAPGQALIARMGGEEFAILMPAGGAVAPDTILARLRAARMPFDVIVTASIGACIGPIASESDWKSLYRHADRALFEAKQAGRDRVRFASPLAA